MLNLGFRYDIETPRHEALDNASIFDPTVPNPGADGFPGAIVFAGKGNGRSGHSSAWVDSYKKDVAPRIGFAYAPDRFGGKMVFRGGYGIYYGPLDYADFGSAGTLGFSAEPSFTNQVNFFDPAFLLDNGVPSFPAPPNLDPAQANGQGGSAFGGVLFIAPDYARPGMIQNWSFEIQHQLAPDLIFSVGYIGNHATRLNSNLQQLNAIDPKYLSLGTKLLDCLNSDTVIVNGVPTPKCAGAGAVGRATLAGLGVTVPSWFEPLYHDSGNDRVGQLLLPFPQYQSGAVGSASGITTNCCLENLGQSTYHALEAKLERRFRNGLNLLASYTFSKTLTDADSAYAGLTAFNSSDTFNAQNPHDLRSEKALSYQDVPHMFVLSYLYELPVGKGKKFLNKGGVADKVLGGWQIGAVQRYQKGVPFIPFANDANFAGIAFGTPNPRLSRVPGQPLLAPDASSYNPFLGGSGCTPNADGTFSFGGTNHYF